VALNIATMGFWWWQMPEQISRYYESIHDLETGGQLKLERSPSPKIDWGKNRVLTAQDLARTAAVFAAFPPRDPNGVPTGVLSENSIRADWRTEIESSHDERRCFGFYGLLQSLSPIFSSRAGGLRPRICCSVIS
jgi:hypothetical protein